MTNEEFSQITRGFSSTRLGDIFNCSPHTIAGYRRKSNPAPIPERIAAMTRQLDEYLKNMENMQIETNLNE